MKDAIIQEVKYTSQRDKVGMTIRRWDAQGGHWRLQALFALMVEALKRDSKCEPIFPLIYLICSNNEIAYEGLFSEWQQFIDHLEAMDIMDAPAERSIIDGKLLSKELGGAKPGVWMRPALEVVMEWQLRNPGITDYKDAVEEVRKRSEELKIPKP